MYGVLLLVSLAEARKPPPDPGPEVAVPTRESVDAATETVTQEVDLDVDGRADVINILKIRSDGQRVLVEKRVDLNRDGRVDVWSEFDMAGVLQTEKMDADFDGQVDWIDHYKDGVRVLAEMDSNFDSRIDTWFYYIPGPGGRMTIDRKERDTNRDGRVDVWERFDAAGTVVRTGRDTDGDGTLDERDE